MKFYINLFGDSIRYSHCSIPKEQFEKMNRVRIKNNTTWEQLLLDLDFLHHFGFARANDKIVTYPSITVKPTSSASIRSSLSAIKNDFS